MSVSLVRCLGLLGLALVVTSPGCAGRGVGSSPIVTDTGNSDPRVRAVLGHECVRAGGGQTLTVHTDGDVGVQYVSTYADGEPGGDGRNGGGHGGQGLGLSSDGVMEESWTVSREAPPGIVVVYVNALLPGFESADPDEAFTRLKLFYLLVGPQEECPKGDPEMPSADVVTDTGEGRPPVRTTLARECVDAGERQILTVRSSRGSVVTYNTIYANGENGRPRPSGGGYGGSGFGVVTQEGKVELSWTIEEDAPAGVARVLLAVSLGSQSAVGSDERAVNLELAFRVAGPRECA